MHNTGIIKQLSWKKLTLMVKIAVHVSIYMKVDKLIAQDLHLNLLTNINQAPIFYTKHRQRTYA